MLDDDRIEITTKPLDAGELSGLMNDADCGATVTLDGYVRKWTAGRETLHLVYEAYEPMAIREMRILAAAARERFAISRIAVVHRLGKLDIGETSVIIAVSAPHRGPAFDACQWLITELKRTVPIWKKEVYADGSDWVDPQRSRDPGDGQASSP